VLGVAVVVVGPPVILMLGVSTTTPVGRGWTFPPGLNPARMIARSKVKRPVMVASTST
jgi:hypothetical protein